MLSVKTFKGSDPSLHTLFCLSGFPDTHNLFNDHMVPQVFGRHDTIVACLPDYDQANLSRPFGFNSSQIIDLITATLDHHAKSKKLGLILHDWGVIYGLRWYLANQERVKHIVCLDVLSLNIWETSLKEGYHIFFRVLLYQTWLAATFLMAMLSPQLGNIALALFVALNLGPDSQVPPYRDFCQPFGLRPYMTYPYFHSLIEFILRKGPQKDSLKDIHCPLAYFYGLNKSFQLHSRAELSTLSRSETFRAIKLTCGHWIPHNIDPQFIKDLSYEIERPD